MSSSVTLIARAGQEPKLFPSQDPTKFGVVSLRAAEVAYGQSAKNLDGSDKDGVWHNVVFVGGLAKVAYELIDKGTKFTAMNGIIEYFKPEGSDRTYTNIVFGKMGSSLDVDTKRDQGATFNPEHLDGNQAKPQAASLKDKMVAHIKALKDAGIDVAALIAAGIDLQTVAVPVKASPQQNAPKQQAPQNLAAEQPASHYVAPQQPAPIAPKQDTQSLPTSTQITEDEEREIEAAMAQFQAEAAETTTTI